MEPIGSHFVVLLNDRQLRGTMESAPKAQRAGRSPRVVVTSGIQTMVAALRAPFGGMRQLRVVKGAESSAQ